MTKKEKAKLHSDKCQVEAVDAQLGRGLEVRYIVGMSLTTGELLALKNSFIESRTPVSEDLLAFLRNACERAGITL